MRIAVCPGSFDPVTNGHLDIFERASKIFDVLIVAVFHNPNKKPFFSMEERVEMLRAATGHIANVQVDGFSGLLTEYVRQQNTTIIVRGLRALSDFEYEFQRALLIKKVDSGVETVFMMTSNEYSFVSSTGVKELAMFGGNITGLIPKPVEDLVFKRLKELRT
ncbi:MAG: pantetheine-phosphate adenylyltransferase [Negativicutes bacterium]|nr:pantetheine-phosphate adenylyltransferase [Negativicutes bacterium]